MTPSVQLLIVQRLLFCLSVLVIIMSPVWAYINLREADNRIKTAFNLSIGAVCVLFAVLIQMIWALNS
jgi:hypothetical protein